MFQAGSHNQSLVVFFALKTSAKYFSFLYDLSCQLCCVACIGNIISVKFSLKKKMSLLLGWRLLVLSCVLVLPAVLPYAIQKQTENPFDFSASTSSEESQDKEFPQRQHVTKIARPDEVRLPTFNELAVFLGAKEYGSNRAGVPKHMEDEENLISMDDAAQKAVLNFSDLLTLLAIWHLASEFNNYEVKKNASETDISDTNLAA